MRRFISAWMAACLLWPRTAGADVHHLCVPLSDGSLSAGQLVSALKQIDVPDSILDELPGRSLSIPMTGIPGWLAVRAVNQALGSAFHVSVTQDALDIAVDVDQLPADWNATCDALGRFTTTVAPDAVARQRERWGLSLPTPLDVNRPVVILVHGLDGDAGSCRCLADLMTGDGMQAATFSYPDEKPLGESAKMLGDQLSELHRQHPDLVMNVVAQSMGGLVARQYIEGPDYAGGIDHLILIGTPNHGSDWADLSVLKKLTVNSWRWRNDPQWSLAWTITEGLCQAGIDLRPDSQFLKNLNALPRRDGVKYTIVAGDRSEQHRIEGDVLLDSANLIPWSEHWGLRQINAAVQSEGHALLDQTVPNDGPVTLQSAQLSGVSDFVTVHADHVALYESRDGQPPGAWALVRDRLENHGG